MKYLLVDDERISLRNLERIMLRIDPSAEILSADNYKDALKLGEENPAVAFLDIEMPGMSGVELAKELRKKNDKLNIVFVTAYDNFAREAYQLHASGYVTKPCSAEDIKRELENLRYPIIFNKMKVRCFGKFEVFLDDKPVHFERTTAKEVFAYLVHLRGATATRMDICTALWEDSDEIEKRKGYFRSIMASLRKSLRDIGREDVLVASNNNYSILADQLNCDYYRYLNGESMEAVKFRGEYMTQYSWAEESIGPLLEMSFERMRGYEK